MEKIINYKIKDFFRLEDETIVSDYLTILDCLNPLKQINNPHYRWYKRNSKTIQIKAVRMLSLADVIDIRNNFNQPSFEGIISSIKIVTQLQDKDILNFTITQFYGIISFIKSELMAILNMENNELADDTFDINVEAVNAKQRMGRFGFLNLIDALAKEDVLKWKEIEKLPYMTVFTKLIMDNEKLLIQKEIAELQRKKQVKN